MAWVYLILAGLFEIGWPIGLKLAGNENFRWQGMTISFNLRNNKSGCKKNLQPDIFCIFNTKTNNNVKIRL